MLFNVCRTLSAEACQPVLEDAGYLRHQIHPLTQSDQEIETGKLLNKPQF